MDKFYKDIIEWKEPETKNVCYHSHEVQTGNIILWFLSQGNHFQPHPSKYAAVLVLTIYIHTKKSQKKSCRILSNNHNVDELKNGLPFPG